MRRAAELPEYMRRRSREKRPVKRSDTTRADPPIARHLVQGLRASQRVVSAWRSILPLAFLGMAATTRTAAGTLKATKRRPAMRQQRRLRRAPSRAEAHDPDGHLTVDIILDPEGSGLGHVRVLQQAIRDLQGRDVDAALDDDVLLSSGDVDVPIRITPREVARPETVLRDGDEPVWTLPVRRCHLPAADHHLALFARRQLRARIVEDAYAHVAGGPADRAVLALVRMVAAHEAGLGASGELDDGNPVRRLELQVLVEGEGRRARGHEAKRRQLGFGDRPPGGPRAC